MTEGEEKRKEKLGQSMMDERVKEEEVKEV